MVLCRIVRERCTMERNWFDEEWKGFNPGRWSSTSVNLRDFIQKNFTPYDGDESFLAGPTEATTMQQAILTRILKR